MAKSITDEDLDLLNELGVVAEPEKGRGLSAREQRIIAGFEEIERFVEEHGRLPQHGENRDIFERLYAVRLDRLRDCPDCRAILNGRDKSDLLECFEEAARVGVLHGDELEYGESDDELLAVLGAEKMDGGDIMKLRHVRSTAQKRAADEIAQRTPCGDFDKFKPLFECIERDIRSGLAQTQVISAENRAISEQDFFILNGLMLYVAEVGEPLKTTANEVDCRLRVILSNGTESNLLLRSLQRAFYDDPFARRVVRAKGDLQLAFCGEWEPHDVEAGTIYVLRSRANEPFISANREVIHKIGVTGGDVKGRIANARKDPTYLLADVEIVATYKLANINRTKLEQLLHKFFASAQLDMELKDRFGFDVTPREWFLVPLPVIQEAVQKLLDGTISDYYYNAETAELLKR